MSGDTVILVEVEVTAPGGATTTLRFADRAIRPMAPTDALRPNAIWDDRLTQAPALRRALVEDLSTLSAGWGVAQLSLANGDGALDTYRTHIWGEVRVYRWTEGSPFATAVSLFEGRAALPTYDRSAKRSAPVSVGFYDPRVELDQPLQVNLYSGAGGYTGPAELTGRPKPLAFGDLSTAHIPAPRIEVAAGVYQLHDGQIAGLSGVFDRGDDAGLASDGDKVGAAFDAWAPAPAHYATDLERGLFKANTTPVGAATFGFLGDAGGGYVNTAGPILARLLARLGVPGDRIGASIAGLASTAPVGVFDQSGGAGREILGWLSRSVLAAVLPDRAGVWQAVRLAPPKPVADYAIDYFDIIDLIEDPSAPTPAGIVRVGWGRIWTTFRADDIAPALKGTAAAIGLEAEYRYAQVEDAAAKARGPGAWRTLELQTALRSEADALALAAQLKTLFGLRPDGAARTLWKVQMPLTDAVMAVELGATVRLTYPPRGIDETFVLLVEEPHSPGRDMTTWTLWG
ncbi:hypothetical protein OVA11_14275 [Caulobacter sp. SL161]|uniref:hypothetical protein n=1 Tax=Caulobacter sp. SL161 TaxID=2995156 RepID=UPI0022726CD7|nr:hypothetical protein [Caulobacter sp. SL161]MCY1648187.1 hypothetical protein [Caulobacter sp. SL161]